MEHLIYCCIRGLNMHLVLKYCQEGYSFSYRFQIFVSVKISPIKGVTSFRVITQIDEVLVLIRFFPIFLFDSSWKYQKTLGKKGDTGKK